MRRFVLALLALAALMAAPVSTAQEPKRLALLIGNKSYTAKVGPLKNPLTDVDLVEVALKKLGFRVTVLKDATYKQMDTAIKRYASEVRRAGQGALSFFYYSGHGVANPETQVNYLIPVDLADVDDDKVWFESLQQSAVIDLLSRQAGGATHYLVFDACRNELNVGGNNAKSLGAEKGFVQLTDTSGLLIAYATAPRRTAADGGPGGGPYARVLAEELVRPGVEAVTMFRNVQIRVKQSIGQDPWLSFPALPEVYLAGRAVPPSPAVGTAQRPAEEPTYRHYVEAFEAQRPILKGTLFPPEALGPLPTRILDGMKERFAGRTWQGGDDWGRIVFDAAGRSARYFDDAGREAGRLLIQGVMSDAGQTLGGTRSVTRQSELIGEWHQADGQARGGFILKLAGDDIVMNWGPLFRRESRWQPARVAAAQAPQSSAQKSTAAPQAPAQPAATQAATHQAPEKRAPTPPASPPKTSAQPAPPAPAAAAADIRISVAGKANISVGADVRKRLIAPLVRLPDEVNSRLLDLDIHADVLKSANAKFEPPSDDDLAFASFGDTSEIVDRVSAGYPDWDGVLLLMTVAERGQFLIATAYLVQDNAGQKVLVRVDRQVRATGEVTAEIVEKTWAACIAAAIRRQVRNEKGDPAPECQERPTRGTAAAPPPAPVSRRLRRQPQPQ